MTVTAAFGGWGCNRMSKVIRVPDELVAEVEAMLVARRVGTGGRRWRVKPMASPVTESVTEGFESPATPEGE